MSKSCTRILFAIASIAVSVAGFDPAAHAQGTGSCLGSTSKPAISAIYLDNYAGLHSLGKKVSLPAVGDSQLVFHLCSINDTKHYLIVRNDDANDFNPGKFSKEFRMVREGWFALLLSAGVRCGIRCGSGGFYENSCRRHL